MIEGPCYNCEKRYRVVEKDIITGEEKLRICHSECEEYLHYKDQLDKYNKIRQDTEVMDYTLSRRPWLRDGK